MNFFFVCSYYHHRFHDLSLVGVIVVQKVEWKNCDFPLESHLYINQIRNSFFLSFVCSPLPSSIYFLVTSQQSTPKRNLAKKKIYFPHCHPHPLSIYLSLSSSSSSSLRITFVSRKTRISLLFAFILMKNLSCLLIQRNFTC